MKRGNSSVGRAQPCQGWGREFESRFPLTFGQVESLPSPGGGMVDALVSGASVSRRAGSSPVLGTEPDDSTSNKSSADDIHPLISANDSRTTTKNGEVAELVDALL